MTRQQLDILLAAATQEAVEELQVELDALKKRLAGVTVGLQVAELREAAKAARDQGITLH